MTALLECICFDYSIYALNLVKVVDCLPCIYVIELKHVKILKIKHICAYVHVLCMLYTCVYICMPFQCYCGECGHCMCVPIRLVVI